MEDGDHVGLYRVPNFAPNEYIALEHVSADSAVSMLTSSTSSSNTTTNVSLNLPKEFSVVFKSKIKSVIVLWIVM